MKTSSLLSEPEKLLSKNIPTGLQIHRQAVCSSPPSGIPIETSLAPNDDIELKFQQLAEENERNFRKFIQSIEKMDTRQTDTSSFVQRMQEYKAKAELCI